MNFTNGIVLLLSVVKHQSELDTKVNFPQLNVAIDEIDTAMGYSCQGPAKQNVCKAAGLNKDAQSTYHESVGPVFNWCGEAIDNFNAILPHIKKANVSNEDKDFIWKTSVTTINDGLMKSEKSLKQLDDVQVKSSRVKNLLASSWLDSYTDFWNIYGNKLRDLQNSIDLYEPMVNQKPCWFHHSLLKSMHGDYAKKLQLAKNEKSNIYQKMYRIRSKIERASEVAEKFVIPNLEEDATNLVTLRGNAGTVDNQNPLLEMESVTLRTSLAGPIQDLIDQCGKYRSWHGKN